MAKYESNIQFFPTTCQWIDEANEKCNSQIALGPAYCGFHQAQAYQDPNAPQEDNAIAETV